MRPRRRRGRPSRIPPISLRRLKHDVLEAQMAMMTPEQRAEFAKKAAEIAARDAKAE